MGIILILISVILFIVGMYLYSHNNINWLKSEYILFGTLIAILLQAFILNDQTETLKQHFLIQQRPVVVISDIESKVLSGETLQSKIGNNDEFIVNIVFKNIGQSPAFVEYVKVKVFYGYFFKDRNKVRFGIHDMAGSQTIPLKSLIEEVPTENRKIFEDSIFSPNQKESFSTMVDAKTLMGNIRSYTTSREAPIFIECEIRYSSGDKKDSYSYNCIYELQWPLAKHITIYSLLIKSNSKDEPLHLTLAQLVQTVAERQDVKSVINAFKSGGEDLKKKLEEIFKQTSRPSTGNP